MGRSASQALALLVGATACGGGASPVPVGARVGPALAAALAGADHVRAPWRCAAPDGPGLVDETVTRGEQRWVAAGRNLRLDGKGDMLIGVVADAGGAAPATIAALGRLRGKLAHADVVLALGGMGATQQELEATLGALADKAPYAIIALPGDLEPAAALAAAITTLRTRGDLVFDGRLARHIELPGVMIGTVPGAGAASRLVPGPEGCGYRASDVAALLAELTPHPSLRILASSEAPRGISDGEATGELALTTGAGEQIDVALHGPTTVAPSRARNGGRDGEAIGLSPGTLDATSRLPGPARPSSAGLLAIHGTSWTWKPITDAE